MKNEIDSCFDNLKKYLHENISEDELKEIRDLLIILAKMIEYNIKEKVVKSISKISYDKEKF